VIEILSAIFRQSTIADRLLADSRKEQPEHEVENPDAHHRESLPVDPTDAHPTSPFEIRFHSVVGVTRLHSEHGQAASLGEVGVNAMFQQLPRLRHNPCSSQTTLYRIFRNVLFMVVPRSNGGMVECTPEQAVAHIFHSPQYVQIEPITAIKSFMYAR
jgi:hypothetical protein